MTPVFHLNFPNVDLGAPILPQLENAFGKETDGWPSDLVAYAKALLEPLVPVIHATAGQQGKAIVMVSGSMAGQIQYVVSKFA